MKPQIIVKIWKNKGNGQLLISVPKKSDLKEGDYVWLIKVKNLI